MLTVLFFVFQSVFHPFHVSVSDIKYKEKKQILQVSTRVFLEDMEQALQLYSGNANLDITSKSEWESVNEWVRDYFLEKFSISDHKSRLMHIVYVGAEIEKDVIWIYTELPKVKKLRTLVVDNRILIEEFPNQENLVHFRAKGKVKTASLNKENTTRLFQWN